MALPQKKTKLPCDFEDSKGFQIAPHLGWENTSHPWQHRSPLAITGRPTRRLCLIEDLCRRHQWHIVNDGRGKAQKDSHLTLDTKSLQLGLGWWIYTLRKPTFGTHKWRALEDDFHFQLGDFRGEPVVHFDGVCGVWVWPAGCWLMVNEGTLPETNVAPENGWLEDDMSFWDGLFSGAMLVLRSVYSL